MPMRPRFQGDQMVYVYEAWPPACDLRSMPKTSDLTPDERAAEEAAYQESPDAYDQHMHRLYCENPTCPAKR